MAAVPSEPESDWPYYEALTPERAKRQQQIVDALPLFQLLGVKLEAVETDWARISITFRDNLTQPAGILHGGMHATLVDTAVAQALTTTLKLDYSIVTIQMDTKYFRPTSTGKVYAEARLVRKGRTIAHGDVDLKDEEGRLLGKGWCVYAILKRPSQPYQKG